MLCITLIFIIIYKCKVKIAAVNIIQKMTRLINHYNYQNIVMDNYVFFGGDKFLLSVHTFNLIFFSIKCNIRDQNQYS